MRALDPIAEAVFGGKACGLARLIAAGARVPPGFAVPVTTSAPHEWSEDARAEFVRRAAALLVGGKLAVRSSACGEDSKERSFAGLLETVLGVTGVDQALSAAAACIESGRGERVRAYAGTMVPVGLVVQAQVSARAAGVCFTLDPTGRDRAIVLEAVAGAGDRLVSGRAQPERWRIYRSGTGAWEARPDGQGPDAPALTAGDAISIAEQAAGLADLEGHPLDLEWAIDGDGVLWWLQARPITAARAPQEFVVERAFEDVDDGPVTVWSNWNVRETLPDPLRPLTWTTWREVIVPMVMRQMLAIHESSTLRRHLCGIDLVHGRVYFNMNALLAPPLFGGLMRRTMTWVDPGAAETVSRLASAGVFRPRRLPASRLMLLRLAVLAALESTPKLARALLPRRCLRALETAGAVVARRGDLSTWSDVDVFAELRLFTFPECAPLRDGLYMETVAMLVYHLARRAFRHHPDAGQLLSVGIAGNPTTGIALGIDDLVDAARPLAPAFLESSSTEALLARLAADAGGGEWLGAFREFLGRNGHRCPKEFDFGVPRWAEDPAMLLDLVRAGLRSPRGERLRERMLRLAAQRRQAVRTAVAGSPFWRRPGMRLMATLVELYMPLREAPKHYGFFVFQRMRQAALELGRRLVDRGILAAADDVFFLEWAELARLVSGGAPRADTPQLLEQRRARLERYRAERAPDFLRSDGVPVVDRASPPSGDRGDLLRGIGVSAGRATGPVRILLRPDPAAMADGDVIVMEFADPGWTPLFPRASGVVMEVGGLMCHAAVVARELGIPAVFGVSGAMRLLHDGVRVTVDGTDGTVAVRSLLG